MYINNCCACSGILGNMKQHLAAGHCECVFNLGMLGKVSDLKFSYAIIICPVYATEEA